MVTVRGAVVRMGIATSQAAALSFEKAGSSLENVSSWPKADKQWYLGVRCRRCRLPILFAVDRSEGTGEARAPSAGRLVLTCTLETCRYRADYNTATVARFQKEPVKRNETRTNSERKSRKR